MKTVSQFLSAHKAGIALAIAAVLIFSMGFWSGGKYKSVANEEAAVPKLEGYEFTGVASYSAKDPKGNAVAVHYERQPKGYVIYIEAEKADDSSGNRPGSLARR